MTLKEAIDNFKKRFEENPKHQEIIAELKKKNSENSEKLDMATLREVIKKQR